MTTQSTLSLSNPDDEKIFGAEAIAKELGLSVQQVFYGLERGLIPADKYGRRWVSTRRRLRALGAGVA